jgi:hypothetical protein
VEETMSVMIGDATVTTLTTEDALDVAVEEMKKIALMILILEVRRGGKRLVRSR